MMKIVKENLLENVEVQEPKVKPGIKPNVKPGRPSPIKRERPSVSPRPKASAEDVAKRYMKLIEK